nr:hypothetical protein [uncultured Rhodopila sp.]
MEPQQQRPKRLCASLAKATYDLTDRHLLSLSFQEARNPHYRNAPPMRLYLEDEVIALSNRVEEQRQYEIEHAAEIAADKLAAAKERRAAAAAEAKAFVSKFEGVRLADSLMGQSDLPLPHDFLRSVVDCLAAGYEPDGVRGAGVVARDLLNISSACSDLRVVVRQHGLPALGARVPALADADIHRWDDVIRDPNAFKLPHLKRAAKALGEHTTGNKPEIIVRVLSALGARHPVDAPANLLKAMHDERGTYNETSRVRGLLRQLVQCGHPKAGMALMQKSTATMQAEILPFAETLDDLVALHAQHWDEHMRRYREAIAALDAVRQQRMATRRGQSITCECGMSAAKACVFRKCGNCCRAGFCARHGRR